MIIPKETQQVVQKKISLFNYQVKFFNSIAKYTYLRAGLGAGKSFVLATWILHKVLTNPETMGCISANSYRQLNDSILRELFKLCTDIGYKYRYNSLTGTITFENGCIAKAISLENYDILRGIEFGWAAVDEGAFAKVEAWRVLIGRIRCPNSKALQVRMVSTPNGFNWVYDTFVGSPTADCHEVYGNPYDNIFLPEGYLDSLKATYDPISYKQEILGEYVTATEGRVYYAFDRERHVRSTKYMVGNLFGGADFNVNPITGIIGNVTKNGIYVKDEIWKRYSNTFELANIFEEKEPNLHTIIPDATGKAMKSSSVKSDHQILRDAGYSLKNTRVNPHRKDRFNAVNLLFSNDMCFIDPSCEFLIRDLENFTHEDSHKDLGHISDALGYPVWYYFPLKKQNKSKVIEV